MIAGWSLFFNDLTEQLPLVVDGIPETTDRVFRRSFCGWLWEVLSVLWGEYLYATENMKDIS